MSPFPEAALGVVEIPHIHKFLAASLSTLFIYDFLLTFGDEVEHVWSHAFGVTDVLFLAARYSAFPEIIVHLLFNFGGIEGDRSCQIAGGYVCLSMGAGMLLSQEIVVLRTWAIWNGSRAARVYGSLAIVAISGFCTYFTAEWISHTQFIAFPHLHSCATIPQYRQVYLAWVFFSIVDLVSLVLTAIKGREHFRPGSPRLVSLLYRDAFAYFTLTFVLTLANVLVAAFAKERHQCLLIGFERILYLTVACRIVVHLRAAALRPEMTIEATSTGLMFRADVGV